jgi:hypothetical protein
MRFRPILFSMLFPLLLSSAPAGPAPAEEAGEPDRVVVQHCLIGFKRSIPGKKVARTKKEAGTLAGEILSRARNGEPFDNLVKEYTDDAYPGIYILSNEDQPYRSGERRRSDMVPGFGNMAFGLGVGEFGLVPYHGYKSPYGWHIILRLE